MNTLPTSVKAIQRTAIVLLLVLLFGVATTAQAQTLTIGSAEVCAAPEVLIPITGSDLINVGSVTLFITFDSNHLTYQSIENLDPQLNGMIYALNTNPFQLAFVWSNVVPVEFLQKKLFDIRFTYIGGTTPVAFNSNCEISNNQLQILPVNYISGLVNSAIPQISLQPKDTMVNSWALASFITLATNASDYLWKESSDSGQTWSDLGDNSIYFGTHTNHLTLAYAPPSYNKNRYMCILNRQNCAAITLQATLTVDTLASVPGYTAKNDLLLQNEPNPVKGFTIIEYTLRDAGSVSLEIMDMCGKIIAQPVNEIQANGKHYIRFETSGLTPGLYFYRINFKNEHSGFTASRKMIKQNN